MVKTIFIPAKINSDINVNKIQSLKLPKNIAIAYSIQYRNIALKIKENLQKSKKHKITGFIQVLGCSQPVFPKETQAILLISSGKFHAVSLALESNLPVYLFEGNNLNKISAEEIEHLRKKEKTEYLKFLSADKIGILISTKPGQENLKKALELKRKLKDKKSYLFLGDNFNPSEFENFSLKSWVNSACRRLDMGFPVLNMEKLKKI